jgi:hypothetical protein
MLLPDVRLQRLVYLAVPGLFRSELERRRHFRLVNPQCPPLAPPVGALDLTLDDSVSLSLREVEDADEESKLKDRSDLSKNDDEITQEGAGSTRYLKCPAAVTVRHLVRLLMLKRGWEEANTAVNNRIEITYQENDAQRSDEENMRPLDLSWTLLDLACIFRWKKVSLMIRLTQHAIDRLLSILQEQTCLLSIDDNGVEPHFLGQFFFYLYSFLFCFCKKLAKKDKTKKTHRAIFEQSQFLFKVELTRIRNRVEFFVIFVRIGIIFFSYRWKRTIADICVKL